MSESPRSRSIRQLRSRTCSLSTAEPAGDYPALGRRGERLALLLRTRGPKEQVAAQLGRDREPAVRVSPVLALSLMFLMTAIFFLSWFGQSVNGLAPSTTPGTSTRACISHLCSLRACQMNRARAMGLARQRRESRTREIPGFAIAFRLLTHGSHVPNSVPQSPALLFADPARL
jgi:hypothetical protein